MLKVRRARDVEDFARGPDDSQDYADQVAAVWRSGAAKREWSFVADDGDTLLGRVGYRVTPTTTEPEWHGRLPENEMSVFGLHLRWRRDALAVGRELFADSLTLIADEVPAVLGVGVNAAIHADAAAMVATLEALEFPLFQEKQGYYWRDSGRPVEVPGRLGFLSLAEVGPSDYAAVMARCGRATRDRNDRYYWEGCGASNWASQMMAFVSAEEEQNWLLAYEGEKPVGYIAVSAFTEPNTASITHAGVVPSRRGHGYINDLLAAGTEAARRSGYRAMLSDVDVENTPMHRALLRAGHRADARPWHVWSYRVPVKTLISGRSRP